MDETVCVLRYARYLSIARSLCSRCSGISVACMSTTTQAVDSSSAFVTDAYTQWMLTGAQEAQNRAEQERKAEADKRRAAATTAKGKGQGQET